MNLVNTEINICLTDGNPPYYLCPWTSKGHVPKYQPHNGEGRKNRIKGLLPAGSGGLAGKEILGWAEEDGKVQRFRLRKMVIIQLLWKIVWQFLKKLNINLPCDPGIPLLGIYPR